MVTIKSQQDLVVGLLGLSNFAGAMDDSVLQRMTAEKEWELIRECYIENHGLSARQLCSIDANVLEQRDKNGFTFFESLLVDMQVCGRMVDALTYDAGFSFRKRYEQLTTLFKELIRAGKISQPPTFDGGHRKKEECLTIYNKLLKEVKPDPIPPTHRSDQGSRIRAHSVSSRYYFAGTCIVVVCVAGLVWKYYSSPKNNNEENNENELETIQDVR